MVEVKMQRLAVFLILSILGGGLSARGSELDLFTPDMQKIKKEYLQRSGSYIKSRQDDLSTLVQGHLKAAQTSLDEKTATGNVTGMAIWRKAVSVFEQCAQDLKEKKDFEIPDKVRRELNQTMEEFRGQKKAIEDKYGVLINPLRDRYYQLFAGKAKEQPGGQEADEAKLKEWFAELVASADPAAKPIPAPAQGESPKAGEPAAVVVVDPTAAVPEIVGASGDAAEWVTFGRWYAEVSAVEIIEIPVMGISEPKRSSGESMGENTGAAFSTRFDPARVLKPAGKLVFRVKSIPKRLAADIMEWPNPGNNWCFTVRLRPGPTLPSPHGLELQVNADARTEERTAAPASAGGEAAKGNGGAGMPPVAEAPQAAAKVKIRVTSTPPGALVFVNGQPYADARGALRTPCMVEAAEGKHELRLVSVGYVDGVLKDFEFKPGATADWTFVKGRPVDETTVKAFAQTGWRTSRMKVIKGDQVIVAVHGAWNAGGGRADTDANGYASAASYSGPAPAARRITAAANFGGLLMRVGEKGTIRPVGRSGTQIVADEEGEIFFGINEAESDLKDNAGSLTVKIQKFGRGAH